MSRRHLFPRPRHGAGRLTAAMAVSAGLAIGCGALAAPAGAHWQPGQPAHSHHSHWHDEGLGGYGPPPQEGVTPVATGLNQPKKLTVAPDGSLLVAESGNGEASSNCITGEEGPVCLNQSGAIARITPWDGHVSTALGNLPSISEGGGATGPAEARYINGSLEVLFQDTGLDPTTGESPFGAAGALLGDLVRYPLFWSGGPDVQASFGPFEAQHNPDNGAGSAVEGGQESAIDSDPYSFVPYHGGYVVADAAGNDLLYVAPWGGISVLAVFPTISETVPPGTLGPEQTQPVPFQSQAVPDSVAVGRDGALYVGELGGFPFNAGTDSVYRVVPGHAPTVVASGFTAIGDIAFDPWGRLLVLEIDQKGLADPALEEGGLPTPGALIGVDWHGKQSTLATTGLEFPTGLAVSPHGTVYVSNFGILSATGGPEGLSGQVDRVGLPGWWWHH